MRRIIEQYNLTCEDQYVGSYYIFSNNTYSYEVSRWESVIKPFKDLLKEKGLLVSIGGGEPVASLQAMMNESNRVKGQKKVVYVEGPFKLTRISMETNERFIVYRREAKKGEPYYSEKSHSAPHYEGSKTPEGMNEWTTWYAFVKMDDGTFMAELDESWWWGGGHNDGGTIRTEIPEEWWELSYDEFLAKVVTLSAASHYGFTPDELKAKEGLREFFGFNE